MVCYVSFPLVLHGLTSFIPFRMSLPMWCWVTCWAHWATLFLQPPVVFSLWTDAQYISCRYPHWGLSNDPQLDLCLSLCSCSVLCTQWSVWPGWNVSWTHPLQSKLMWWVCSTWYCFRWDRCRPQRNGWPSNRLCHALFLLQAQRWEILLCSGLVAGPAWRGSRYRHVGCTARIWAWEWTPYSIHY